MKQTGYTHIYTGNGKGKTTAALGLTLRACGHGHRVFIGQFMKGQRYGELKALERFSDLVEIRRFGSTRCIRKRKSPAAEDIDRAKKGFATCRKAISSGKYDLVIMDEVNCAVHFGLLECEDVVRLIKTKPPALELVLTGRGATPSMKWCADLVTEMKEVKHYFQKGVMARKGVER